MRILALCCIAAASAGADAQGLFRDRALDRGIGLDVYDSTPGFTNGISAADIDDDGDIDLYVPTDRGSRDLLFINQNNVSFQDAAGARGLTWADRSRTGLFFDMDGDRDLDLIALSDASGVLGITIDQTVRLYRNDGGSMVEVTTDAGLPTILYNPVRLSACACAADVDTDGDLDLWISIYGGRSYLYENDGNGHFTDTTAQRGMDLGVQYFWQSVFVDFNGDGVVDLFVAAEDGPNYLLINDGTGHFTEVGADAGVDRATSEMGVGVGDYDNNGQFDIVIANNNTVNGEENTLFRNRSSPDAVLFTNETPMMPAAPLGLRGWGATFTDYDHDGWLDIVLAHEDLSQSIPLIHLYRNSGDGSFSDETSRLGISNFHSGWCVIAADIDRDGDQDLLEVCGWPDRIRILENEIASRDRPAGTLTIKPRMFGRNHRAIGASVRVTLPDGRRLSRAITAGTSMGGQEPAEAHFGLDGFTTIPLVTIEWPDGRTTARRNIRAGQFLTISNCDADYRTDQHLDMLDLLDYVGDWLAGNAPFDTDTDTDINDLMAFVSTWLNGCD